MKGSALLVDFPDEETKNEEVGAAAAVSTLDMSDHPMAIKELKLAQVVPEEYLFDPFNAEPTLDNLRLAALQLESQLDPDGDIVNVDDDYEHGGDNDDGIGDDDDDDDIVDLDLNVESNAASNSNNNINKNNKKTKNKKKKKTSLATLLDAADKDVTLHMARIKAVLAQDPSLLQSYTPQSDPLLQQRSHRLSQIQSHRDDLQSQAHTIIAALNHDLDVAGGAAVPGAAPATNTTANIHKDNVTRANILQARLTAWEKALQLYIYCPPTVDPCIDNDNHNTTDNIHTNSINNSNNSNNNSNNSNNNSNNNNSNNNSNNKPSLSLLQLLHHLTLIAKQDEPLTPTDDESTTLTQTLSHAKQMCTAHLDTVSNFLSDATEQSVEHYQSYQIHLIAHSIAANRTLERTEGIHDSFLLHGREALKVGHALEMAEAKRRQSERASVLIRRWWMMENLAEQEDCSGEVIKVTEEVRGVIPSSSCRMDPLFTRVEHSLEASRVLKSLRMVVKCQSNTGGASTTTHHNSKPNNGGTTPERNKKTADDNNHNDTESHKPNNNNTNNTNTGGFMLDPQALKRFERTNDLLQRTSVALEKRLLNAFSKIYTKGGTYDFSSANASKRNGRIDWVMLRECAEALMNFDSGKSLHKRFVDLVVTTKFPELFLDKDSDDIIDINHNGGSGEFVTDSEGDDHSPVRGENGKTMRRMNTEEQQEFDMDTTRTKLSTLFHRVTEVCTEEFQLIAHVFSPNLPPHLQQDSNARTTFVGNGTGIGGTGTGAGGTNASSTSPSSFSETYPLHVARALLQRIISDPYKGMQAQINDLLDGIDRRGDIDAGAKKLDTFVVIHEKAAGLFSLLKEAAQRIWDDMAVRDRAGITTEASSSSESFSSNNAQSITSLIQFLTSQEMALSSGQRRGYLNLELRLLHHGCCANLDNIGAKFLKPIQDTAHSGLGLSSSKGGGANKIPTLVEYRAPTMAIDKDYIYKGGYPGLLNGPLKLSVLRQPLIHATDSLARARLMFGLGQQGGEDIDSTARVIFSIFAQMCNFYGNSYLFPIVESLAKMLVKNPPSTPPNLPFDENDKPHDLGVDKDFWTCIERIHSAAKTFDRELWAENRTGSVRVWEILVQTRSITSLTLAKDRRIKFFRELEELGEVVILRALDTLSTHIMWILVTGGENMAGSGGTTTRIMRNLTTQSAGPYAVPTGSLLDSINSPAVRALTFCLRSQFVYIQAALTPQSLSAFWTALSMRLYDILVTRLILHYYVSTVGAVVLSRDVEALRTVAMLAGTKHSHWDNLRELLTLFMTPPDALRDMLVGPDGDVNSGKGMFGRVGKDQSIVFMSRRVDYRYKTGQTMKKSQWVIQLLEDLGVNDPTDGRANINIAPYSAENMMEKN